MNLLSLVFNEKVAATSCWDLANIQKTFGFKNSRNVVKFLMIPMAYLPVIAFIFSCFFSVSADEENEGNPDVKKLLAWAKGNNNL